MAVADVALVPEAFVEVTVCSSDVQCTHAGRRQKTLCRNSRQGNYGTVASLGQLRCHPSELLARLDRGEEAWVPELSDESADEGPIKPTLKQLPMRGIWWDRHRSPMTYSSSDSANSDDEQESGEQKPHHGGYRLTILRRNLLSSKGSGSQGLKPKEACKNGSQPKKPLRSQLAKTKAEAGSANESTTEERAAAREFHVSCPVCGQNFKSKVSLSNHQRIHTKTNPYKCLYCGEKFISKKLLNRHQRGHTAEASSRSSYSIVHRQNTKLYECLACKECFRLREQLLLHQKSHATQQPHKCPECGKNFARKELLVKHHNCHMIPKSNILKDKKEEKAESLPETAKTKGSAAPVSERIRLLDIGLTRQQQDQVNLHKCQFCGKCLRFKSLLVDHERMHREARPYKCSQCSKSFLLKPVLMTHMLIHARQAGRQRPKKVKSLAVKSALVDSGISHAGGNSSKCKASRKIITRSVHRTRWPGNQTQTTPCQCQYCGKLLSSRSILADHEKFHTGERPYKCHKCAEGFIRKHHLIRHQESRHGGKLSNHTERIKSLRIKNRPTLPERYHQKACEGLLRTSVVTHNSRLVKQPKIPTQENYVCQYCGKCMKTKSSFVNHGKIHRRNLASHQETQVGEKLPLSSDSEYKMIPKDPPFSLKQTVPHRRKLPIVCQKCGKPFDDNYSFTRHQKIHSGQKPFKCAACGKGFIQMWHLKRHKRTHLKEQFPDQAIVMEGNRDNCRVDQRLFKCAVCGKRFFQAWHLKRHKRIHLNEEWRRRSMVLEADRAFPTSTRGTASAGKDHGDPPGKTLPQTPSHTAEVSSLPHTQEERRDPPVGLKEGSGAGAPEGSEQKEKRITTQVQLSRKFQENNLLDCGEVSQAVKSEMEPRRKGILSLHRPRNCSKNVNSQNHKKEKNHAGWQLRSRVPSSRKSKRDVLLTGKRAKHCFCQQEEREMVPPPKCKPSKKVKYSAGPQSNPCASGSPSLFQGASKNHKPKNLSLELPGQKTFSREAQTTVTGSVMQGNPAPEAQERGSPEANSGSQSCERNCKPPDVGDPAVGQSRPRVPESKTHQRRDRICARNEPPNAPAQNLGTASLAQQLEDILKPRGIQKCIKSRSCVELQTAISRKLQSSPSERKTVADQQRLETSQIKHVCGQCKKSFRSRANLLIHENNHTGNRPFPCTQCEKGFFVLPALNVHMRIHTGEKPFKCPECDFRCNVLCNLNKHKKIHSQGQLQPCVRCGKSFRLNHKLATPLKFSGKKKVYACPGCERASVHTSLVKLNRKL